MSLNFRQWVVSTFRVVMSSASSFVLRQSRLIINLHSCMFKPKTMLVQESPALKDETTYCNYSMTLRSIEQCWFSLPPGFIFCSSRACPSRSRPEQIHKVRTGIYIYVKVIFPSGSLPEHIKLHVP